MIFCWNVNSQNFDECFRIPDITINIMEIKNVVHVLYARSMSRYINVYQCVFNPGNSIIDNQEIVVAMHLFENSLITCDVRYNVR